MNHVSRKIVFHWLPVLIYCVLIFSQSAFPSPVRAPSFPHMDKVSHFVAYAILGGLFYRAFTKTRSEGGTLPLIGISVLSSTLFGASDELHQYFVPMRTADPADLLADLLGSMAGVWLFHCLFIRRARTSRKIVD
ncbi:VanZ family protein [Desulfonema ishimotonii]|nr:VanZ family protein [Desulfonema ishimotonii]